MANILDNIESGFSAAVQRLQTAASQFTGAYAQFVNIPVEYRSPTWQAAKDRADNVRGIISTFTSAIDTAFRWLQSAFGLSGLGQLGFIVPAVPWLTVAAVGGAVSAIMVAYSYMVEELNKSSYIAELQRIKLERIESNQPTTDIDLALDKAKEPNIFADAGELVKWVVIGGAALFIVPKLLERMKRGR